jgi:Skp family chaperone for outer membrane proteins
MKTITVISLASAIAAPAMLAAAPAQAQVSGIAIVDPEEVVLTSNALAAADASVSTTYAAQFTQVKTRQQQLNTQLETIAKPLDTNKDGKTSPEELQAGAAAKSPIIAQLQTAQNAGQDAIATLNAPMIRAEAYAIDQISQKYGAAMQTVVANKKVSLLLSAASVQFSQPAVDLTTDIKAELDRTTPSVSISPPANYQPSQQTIQLLQGYQQYKYATALRQAQAQQGTPAAPAAAPAGPAKPKPSGR